MRRVDVRTVAFGRDTAPSDVGAIFRDVVDHLRRCQLAIERRCLGVAVVRVVDTSSGSTNFNSDDADKDDFSSSTNSGHHRVATLRYIFAISDEDTVDGKFKVAIEQLLRAKKMAASPDSFWFKLEFARFDAARRQDQRCFYSQGLPEGCAVTLTQNLSDDEKQHLVASTENRIVELKSLLRSRLAGFLNDWSESRSRMDDVVESLPHCERFNFDLAVDSPAIQVSPDEQSQLDAFDNSERYWLTWLARERDSIDLLVDRLSQLVENQPPVKALANDTPSSGTFSWQNFLFERMERFSATIDWPTLLAACQRLKVDIRREVDRDFFRAKFERKMSQRELQLCLDYIWRYQKFRHAVSHGVKQEVTLGPDEVATLLTKIARIKKWASRDWLPSTVELDVIIAPVGCGGADNNGENRSCMTDRKIGTAEELRWQLLENNVDEAHLLSSPDEFRSYYEHVLPSPLLAAALSYLSVVEQAAVAKVDDLGDLARKLAQYKICLSVLVPDERTDRDDQVWRDKIYSVLRLYNLRDARKLEDAVALFRDFYRRHEAIVVDSLYQSRYDEAFELAAAFVGLWPPPPPYHNRVVSFFRHCAEDNAAPAIRNFVSSIGDLASSSETVSVDWYAVQPERYGNNDFKDRQLCLRCRFNFSQRLKTAINSDAAFYLNYKTENHNN